MLSNLLPGLRELRAPLTSGVLLLVGVGLLLGGHFDPLANSDGRTDALDGLIEWFGRPGLIGASLLAAYLLGSMVTASIRAVINRLYDMSVWELEADHGEAFSACLMGRGTVPLPMTVLTHHKGESDSYHWEPPRFFPYSYSSVMELLKALEHFPGEGSRTLWTKQPLLKLFTQPLEDGGRRLILANMDLHGEYDRRHSEAELRDGLLLPLPLALVAVMMNSSLSLGTELAVAGTLVVLLTFLFIQARHLEREALSIVLHAISDHTIAIPLLDRIDWQATGKKGGAAPPT